MDEHCTTAMLKVAIKYVKCIANMSFSIVKNRDAEVPRLVLLLVIDSIGILGVIAWVAFPRGQWLRLRYSSGNGDRGLRKCK